MMCHLLWLTYTPISFPARTLFFLFTYWYAEELQKRASVTSLAIVSPHQGSDDVCWQCAELPCGTSFFSFCELLYTVNPKYASKVWSCIHSRCACYCRRNWWPLHIWGGGGDASAVRNEFDMPSAAYSAEFKIMMFMEGAAELLGMDGGTSDYLIRLYHILLNVIRIGAVIWSDARALFKSVWAAAAGKLIGWAIPYVGKLCMLYK